MAPRAHDKGLDIVLHVPVGTPTRVLGDPGRLRQILLNLVGNSIKFTEHGYVLVRVTSREDSMERQILDIAVQDTGIGIPADRVGALFQKFTQVDASTTRRFGGTGLGLAITRRLVELMGGLIEVTSTLGEGSTFRVTLPAILDKEIAAPAIGHGNLLGARALVVDDIAVNRLVLSERLGSWGMQVVEAENGATCMALLREAAASGSPFRFVLLDLAMPEQDGQQLARAIRADPAINETTLVLLSSSSPKGGAEQLRADGFSAYFVKPVRSNMLYEALVTLAGAAAAGVGVPRLLTASSIREVAGQHMICEGGTLSTVQPAVAGRRGRVLLVEDNRVNTVFAVRILEKSGWVVESAVNGREGVALHASGRFDLILMDCQMPEMDGYEATQHIREREGPGEHIPIIALTATAMQGERDRCLAAGMDDFVSKPISVSALNDTLQRWFPGGER